MSRVTIAWFCRPRVWHAPVLLVALIVLAVAGCGPSAPTPSQQPLNAPPKAFPPPPPPPPPPSAPSTAASPAPAAPAPVAPAAPPVPAVPTAAPAPAGAPGAPPVPAAATNALSLPVAGNQPAAAGAISSSALVEQWMTLAKSASREHPNITEGTAIVDQLVKQGTALTPLYDVLADKASSPFAKALATVCLGSHVDAKEAPRIVAMTKPDNDVTTRTCATSLLGALPGAEAETALNALKSDTERQVRFQAFRSLAIRSEDQRKALADLYKLPDTSPAERRDIVLVLSVGSISDSLDLFQEAVKDKALDEATRAQAAQLLGSVGNQSSLAALNECMQNESSETVRTAVKTAVEAITARLNKS